MSGPDDVTPMGDAPQTGEEQGRTVDGPSAANGATVVERLLLPAGTTLYPEECGFVLPDGRYLRLYADGVREELPDGRPVGETLDVRRPQWTAFLIRVGEGPIPAGGLEPVSYRTGCDVEVVLPGVLAGMDDRMLVGLCERLMRRIVALEMDLDLTGHRGLRFPDGRFAVVHVLDMAAGDPYGRVEVA